MRHQPQWGAALALLATLACDSERGAVAEASHEAHGGPAAADAPTPPAGTAGMADVEVPYERRQLTGVRTTEVESRDLEREIRTVGLVVSDERRVRRIQTKISGWIEELFVSFTGEAVRAGQPILSIYSPELVASQSEYLLALDAATVPQTTGADGEGDRRRLLESARTRLRFFDVDSAHISELERTRNVQKRVVLHSPISGYVTLKAVLQGMYVTPEMDLYTVADLDRLWVLADVNEDEIPLIAPGQRARIEVSSAPGERIGVVAYLQPTVDMATRTLRVRFDVENADRSLKPGMYATVTLAHPLGRVLALPDEAVIDTGVRRVVFVEVSDGLFRPREVKLGRKAAGFYEVLDGLVPGERVAVGAQFLLDSESRLRGAAGPAHGAH